MTGDELRKKLTLRREKQQFQDLTENLRGLRISGHRDRGAISSAALDALRDFSRTSTPPNYRIDDTSDVQEIKAWYRELLRSAHIGKEFCCGTGLENFPFIDCVIEDDRWLESLRDTLGDNLEIIAMDGRSVAMSFDDEYQILGFFRLL
ncbi:hypothetical protein [Nocardia asteroides]|uniref:hypothetical protein n=1 Tax=Nocardia asteroides TaxID=1824 RepID=UPI0034266F21